MKKYTVPIAILLVVVAGLALFVGRNSEIKRAHVEEQNDNADVGPLLQKEIDYLTISPEFKIFEFAKNVSGARVLAFDPGGTLLVSQTKDGKISALPNRDADGVADDLVTVVSGLNSPHGMAFRCEDPENPTVCKFYVGEENMLSEFDYDATTFKATNKKKLLDLPTTGGGHYTRTLMFMPYPNQDTLLISVGSSCNVCEETDSRRATIQYYYLDTKKTGPYAYGLRNSVFMAIHPVSGDIWATEMGRDYLGDNLPPDEINIIKIDQNYGWPICYGKNIHDTAFDKNTYIRNPCTSPFETPSHIDIPAHSAPLGLAFFPEEGYPEDYWFNLLVAEHGSWNRSSPSGYKVVHMKLGERGEYLGEEDFITGFIKTDGTIVGRPVDVMILPGGTTYISDDYANKVYLVTKK